MAHNHRQLTDKETKLKLGLESGGFAVLDYL